MDKIQLANDHKDAGNIAFKNNELVSAIRSYHHALLCVKGILSKATMKELGILTGNYSSTALNEGNSKEIEVTEQAKSLKITLHNNLAVCLIKQSKWERAISHCDEALALHPNNCKAMYRRGLAYLELGNFDRAGDDIRKAAKQQPNDRNIRKALSRVVDKEKINNQAEKRVYEAMFGNKA